MPLDKEEEFEVTIDDVTGASALAVQSSINEDENTYFIACGEHSGMVYVWAGSFSFRWSS